jgi:hypothetical protein
MLVLDAGSRDATRLDLATVGHVLAKELRVLVVDELGVFLAELTILAVLRTLVVAPRALLALLSHGLVPLSP